MVAEGSDPISAQGMVGVSFEQTRGAQDRDRRVEERLAKRVPLFVEPSVTC